MTPTWTFPCNPDKSPITARGFKDAYQGMEWRNAPLVGAPTGERNGFDVLDIDPDGMGWYAAKFAAIPETRRHETPRGVHLLFRSAAGLRCSTSRIVPGVHVRAEGGYVIWWPRQGLAVDDWPVADWAGWLLEAARGKPRRNGVLRTSLSEQSVAEHVGDRIAVESIRAALDQLDPCAFEGNRERWLAFMNGAKAIGAPMELFAEWTSRNPAYQRNDDEIERNWHSLRGLHAGAFYAELKAAGIKFTRRRSHKSAPHKETSPEHPVIAATTVRAPISLNPRARFKVLIRDLERDGREDFLFWTGCRCAEMAVEGWPQADVAQGLLLQACKANGLWRALGDEGCKRTIENAFREVKETSDIET